MKKTKINKQKTVYINQVSVKNKSLKHSEQPIKSRKFNFLAISVGLICIILFGIGVRYNLTTKGIIENGEIVRTPVVSLTRATGGGSCRVIIDGKELKAGMSRSLYVGDTISVRYIKGKSRVVQERIDIWQVHLWIGLWCSLLLLGLALLAGGFFPQLDNIKLKKEK